MSKIMITGGGGFIGLALAERLSRDELNSITLVDNFSRGRKDADFQRVLERSNVTLNALDLTDHHSLLSIDNDYDYVYHLAAIVGVRKVNEQPDRVLSVNALSTLNIASICANMGRLKRVFFSSTSEIYAGTQETFGIEVPTGENVPLTVKNVASPRATYMISKMFGEAVLANYGSKFGIPFTIGRYHNVYGPRMGFLHVVPEMFLRIQSSATVKVASPEHTRAFCFIDDAVEMTIQATESSSTIGETLNIGNQNEEIKISALVELISDVMGRPVSIERLPAAEGSPERRCPDTTKIRALTGCEPAVSLRTGIRKTFGWYRDKLDNRHE